MTESEIRKDENTKEDGFSIDLRELKKESLEKAETILGYVGALTQGADVASKIISKETEYVIKLPAEILREMEVGEAWFSKRKDTGELMAQVVHKVGNRTVIEKIPDVAQKTINAGETAADAGLAIAVAVLNKKLDDISNEIDDVKKAVLHVEKGQKNDRFALIVGGRNLLFEAVGSNNEATRREKMINVTQTLNEGAGQLQMEIESLFDEVVNIPDKKMAVLLKDKKFKTEQQKFNETIHEYLDYYYLEQEMRAYANVVLGDNGAIKQVFKQQDDFLKKLDFKKLQTVGRAYKKGTKEVEWLIAPMARFEELKKKYVGFANRENEEISIIVDGQLLELALAMAAEKLKS